MHACMYVRIQNAVSLLRTLNILSFTNCLDWTEYRELVKLSGHSFTYSILVTAGLCRSSTNGTLYCGLPTSLMSNTTNASSHNINSDLGFCAAVTMTKTFQCILYIYVHMYVCVCMCCMYLCCVCAVCVCVCVCVCVYVCTYVRTQRLHSKWNKLILQYLKTRRCKYVLYNIMIQYYSFKQKYTWNKPRLRV